MFTLNVGDRFILPTRKRCMNKQAKKLKNVVVIGASGGIGAALISQLLKDDDIENIFAFSRCSLGKPQLSHEKVIHGFIDLTETASIERLGASLKGLEMDLAIVCSGLLQKADVKPEKSLRQINQDSLSQYFQVNSIGPMLIAQQLVPLMSRNRDSQLAFLSARVGSVSDNRLGGWYGYRASKSALNMLIKTLAIECQRTLPKLTIVGLHPGTVDTNLSKPFQDRVPADKLFTPMQSAKYLLDVLDRLDAADSGKVFAWDKKEITP